MGAGQASLPGRLKHFLVITALKKMRDVGNGQQDEGDQVHVDDRGQGGVVAANRDGQRRERDHADASGNQCVLCKDGSSRCRAGTRGMPPCRKMSQSDDDGQDEF